MEFIHRRGAQRLRIAQREQLRRSSGQGTEAGNTCAALRDWVGVIKIEAVDEVIGREQAQLSIRIEAQGRFVIANCLVEGGGCISALRGIWRGNVLQHFLRRSRPRVSWDHRVWKNAI